MPAFLVSLRNFQRKFQREVKMLVSAKKILEEANKNYYAVPALNTSNLEITKAIVKAGIELNSPLIIQTTPSAIKYAGLRELSGIVKSIAHNINIPIALHLDHGNSIDLVKKCLKNGYTSVMIDASQYSFNKNVNLTKKVVKLAHNKNVQVEAELGRLKGVEDNVKGKNIYTNPIKAVEFVKKTNCDSLAISIGTSHGAYKFKGKPKLNFKLLRIIKHELDMPLVLHGASGIPKKIIKVANKYGAKIKHAKGIPDSKIRKAVKLGINKVNIDSDIRIAFDAAIRKQLKNEPKEFDPRHILDPAMELITKIVKQKIILLGSVNKA